MKNLSVSFLIGLMFLSCSVCDPIETSPCSEEVELMNGDIMVDLIVVVDYSGSMGGAIDAVSLASTEGILKAAEKCNTNLRIDFLGLDLAGNVWGTTSSIFNISQRDYLDSIHMGGISDGSIMLAANRPVTGHANEQGANAVEDLSNLYDWREGSCRAIFYISDEELDGSNPRGDIAHETEEVDLAIQAALDNRVTVFSHLIDRPQHNLAPEIKDMYQRLSDETNGIHITSTPEELNIAFYEELFPEIICNSCGVNIDPCQLMDFIN